MDSLIILMMNNLKVNFENQILEIPASATQALSIW